MTTPTEAAGLIAAFRKSIETPSGDYEATGQRATVVFTKLRELFPVSPALDQAGVAMITAARRLEEARTASRLVGADPAAVEAARADALQALGALDAVVGRERSAQA